MASAGTLLVVLAAVAFGFLAYFSVWARGEGVETEVLLALRFLIAAAILAVITLIRRPALPRAGTLVTLLLMGIVGYFGQSYFYFEGIKHAGAGLTALLLYAHPAPVALLAFLLFKEPLGPLRIAALAVALTGLVLTIGPAEKVSTLGLLFGLGSAAVYTAYVLTGSRAMRGVDPILASTLVCAGAGASFAAAALVTGRAWPTTTAAWLPIICIALVATVLAVTAFLAGLRVIGPTRASTISLLEPATAVAVGAFLLNDPPMSPWQYLGGALILIGAALAARAPGKPPEVSAPGPAAP